MQEVNRKYTTKVKKVRALYTPQKHKSEDRLYLHPLLASSGEPYVPVVLPQGRKLWVPTGVWVRPKAGVDVLKQR
jgi:hypothetical protein